MTIRPSQNGMAPSLVLKTPILITESTWWKSTVEINTHKFHHKSSSTLKSICHVSTKATELLNHQSSTCSKTGILITPWRRFWSASRTKWSPTRRLLNQLTVICSEQHGLNEPWYWFGVSNLLLTFCLPILQNWTRYFNLAKIIYVSTRHPYQIFKSWD